MSVSAVKSNRPARFRIGVVERLVRWNFILRQKLRLKGCVRPNAAFQMKIEPSGLSGTKRSG